MAGLTVADIATEMAAGRSDHLLTGALFRKIRGVESKLQLVETHGALAAMARYVKISEKCM